MHAVTEVAGGIRSGIGGAGRSRLFSVRLTPTIAHRDRVRGSG